jgi:hypothetical protein
VETQTRGSTCPRGKFQNIIDFKICFRNFWNKSLYYVNCSTSLFEEFEISMSNESMKYPLCI